jgi:uncharacterized protein YraI
MQHKIVLAAATAALLLTGPAYAQSMATASSDLNIRSGPGSDYAVIDVMAASSEAELIGCMEDGSWCQVSYNGVEGWVYSGYLSTGSEQVVVVDRMETASVTERQSSGAALSVGAGMTGGAIAGAIIGGPVGAAVGGLAGGSLGAVTAADAPVEKRYEAEN